MHVASLFVLYIGGGMLILKVGQAKSVQTFLDTKCDFSKFEITNNLYQFCGLSR